MLLHVTTDGHEWLIALLGLARSYKEGVVLVRIEHQSETIAWQSHAYAPLRTTLPLRCPSERDNPHWVKTLIVETRPPWRCLRCSIKEHGWRYSTFDVTSPLRWRENRDIMIGHPLLRISRGGLISAQVGALIERRDEMARRAAPAW